MRKLNKNNGITLIALVISIIVMLILVAVSISMAVNGGLFNYAGKAAADTQNAIDKENELSKGGIEVDGKKYTSINEYLYSVKGNNGELFSAPYTKTIKDNYKDEEGKTATIPTGFSVGISEGINKISTGLVIRDAEGNEFVWIPVSKLDEEYKSTNRINCVEPKTLKADEDNISKYYNGQYTYLGNFEYEKEYTEMVKQVREYGGFYIGRYETTIDESGKIGSKYNTTVLTAATTLFSKDGKDYPYAWYGLYYEQKNANVTGNGTDVQTAMIYGQLWDKTMDYIRKQKKAGKTNYDVDKANDNWHDSTKGVVKSGQANPTKEDESGNIVLGDVALNIWDLESNAWEWTQESLNEIYREIRGGKYYEAVQAFGRRGIVTKRAFF